MLSAQRLSQNYCSMFGGNLPEHYTDHISQTTGRPIIFLGQSLGGLLIQEVSRWNIIHMTRELTTATFPVPGHGRKIK